MIGIKEIDDIAVFDFELTSETIEKLMDGIQQLVVRNPEAKMFVYFSSTGGSLAHAQILLDYLNKVQNNVFLAAFHQISSAAFKIFVDFRGEKMVMPYCFATVHEGTKELISRELKDRESFDYFMYTDIMEEMSADMGLFYKKHLTDDELLKICNGKDVYLNTKRLRDIIDEDKN